MNSTKLPIDDYIEEIKDLISKNQNLVLTASPGAGKTTRLPWALKDLFPGKIICLEPRRVAAIAAALRICEESQLNLGQDVGYQVRFENKTSTNTKLIFITEALLNKKLLQDQNLTDIDLVIIDEFHERSANVDITLALLREMQMMGHPIKLIIMSATIDSKKISDYLGQAPIIEVPGKLFPIDLIYQKDSQKLKCDEFFYEQLQKILFHAIQQNKGDILVFLPGRGEIEKFYSKIFTQIDNLKIEILKLHGQLEISEQKKILHRQTLRRIILSTNIAESSITIDGVCNVIDTGLVKKNKWNSQTGINQLEMGRISLASSHQRAGRSARQQHGYCYKMWNKMDELSMPPFEIPEIKRIDLASYILFLVNMGIKDLKTFSWYETPDLHFINNSLEFLKRNQLISEDHRITEMGRKISDWPYDIRQSLLIYYANEVKIFELGVTLASILFEKDFIIESAHQELLNYGLNCDIQVRLELLSEHFSRGNNKFNLTSFNNIKKQIEQIYYQENKIFNEIEYVRNLKIQIKNLNALQLIFLKSYSDKLCRQRFNDPSKFLGINGKGYLLSAKSCSKGNEFIISINGIENSSKEPQITLAVKIDKNNLIEIFKNQIIIKSKIIFSVEKNDFQIEENRFLFDLPLDIPRLLKPDKQQIEPLLINWLQNNKLIFAEKNASLRNFLKRIDYFNNYYNQNYEINWNALIDAICIGETDLNLIFSKDITHFHSLIITDNFKKELDLKCPESFTAPSDRVYPINYELGKAPFIEIRIQELFGLSKSPIVSDQNLTFTLLGPNYRPVQITQDLNSFWKNTYPQIRKELKIKYPKHSWPEDPLSALAVAKGPSQKK